MRVRNGEPIVIGGLYQNNDSTSSRGLPGLMDIPILGELFSFNLTEASPVPSILDLGNVNRAPFSLKIGIDLLKTTGAATTLARPRVTTLDGVEARLNATQTTPIVSSGPNSTVIVNNVTTGITLRLLPRVQPDLTSVEAQLSIAVSSPTGQVNNVP